MPPNLDAVVLLIVSGCPADKLEPFVAEHFPAHTTAEIIAEARERIRAASNYDREALLGEAILRAQDLYTRSHRAGDFKTALGAQKELAKLTRIYEKPPPAPAGDTAEAGELDAIRAHLEPLQLGPPETPTIELARLAAERIRKL